MSSGMLENINVCCDHLVSNDARTNNINRIDFEKFKKLLYKTTFSILKEQFINKLLELLWDLL